MVNERITYLFEKYVSGVITDIEKQELAVLSFLPANKDVTDRLLERQWERTSLDQRMPEEKGAEILEKILAPEPMIVKRSTVIRLRRRILVVAAAAIVSIVFGLWFMVDRKSSNDNPVQGTVNHDTNVEPPERNRAMITLGNGDVVYLDSVGSGQLAMEAGVNVIKLGDGKIAYNGRPATGNENISNWPALTYNTLTNPRGSKVIDMTLSDGSHVWLNAGSSITYPVVFMGDERRVTITGEAYFEIEPDRHKPFYVRKDDVEVRVLGTHFNVNAYADEPDIKVTLLEGSISTTTGNGSPLLLKPGEQVAIVDNMPMAINRDADTEQVMAWKNGMFKMKNADIGTIMRQIARWYAIDVEYLQGIPKGTISGEVPRSLTLSEVLNICDYSGVHFEIVGKKVIVKP